jgi:hypothetical protein
MFHRSLSWDWVTIIGWDSKEDSDHMTELTRALRDGLVATCNPTSGPDAAFVSANTSNIFKVSPKNLFGDHYARLVEIKKKYDPTNLLKGQADLSAN